MAGSAVRIEHQGDEDVFVDERPVVAPKQVDRLPVRILASYLVLADSASIPPTELSAWARGETQIPTLEAIPKNQRKLVSDFVFAQTLGHFGGIDDPAQREAMEQVRGVAVSLKRSQTTEPSH